MKNVLLIMLAALTLTACGGGKKRNAATAETSTETSVQSIDPSTVYVYYFHGKQRCKTCVTVEEVTMNTVKETYGNNPKVKYIEVKTDEKANESLVDKYEVTWNALIVAKGDDHIEITKQAFANAVSNPQALKDLIKAEVDKRIK